MRNTADSRNHFNI